MTTPYVSPPEAPDIPLRLRLYPFQVIVLPILLIIPLLALAGVLGGRVAQNEARLGGVRLAANFPATTRYDQPETLRITIYNDGGTPLTGAMLRVTRDYLDNFTALHFVPSDVAVDESAYRVALDDVPAGRSLTVNLDYRSVRVGALGGSITLEYAAGEGPVLEISTFVFP